MSYLSVILIGLGLSADAFSVSISKGLACRSNVYKNALACGITFGLFQGLMPLIGWFIGSSFANIINEYSGYVGCAILAFIGGKMIFDAIKGEDDDDKGDLTLKSLLILGVATSIDALAVGVTFATPELNAMPLISAFFVVLSYCAIITVTTLIMSFIGFVFGEKLKSIIGGRAEILGGAVLIGIGIKLLVEMFI